MMRATDRLRALMNTLPSDGAVMLTTATLREWLDGEGDSATDAADLVADPTAAEVAEALRRSESTVRGKCAAGEIPGAYKLNGREWRIPREAFRAYVETQRTGGTLPKPSGKPADLGAWRKLRAAGGGS